MRACVRAYVRACVKASHILNLKNLLLHSWKIMTQNGFWLRIFFTGVQCSNHCSTAWHCYTIRRIFFTMTYFHELVAS